MSSKLSSADSALFQQALDLRQHGENARAIERLSKLLEKVPNYSPALLVMGSIHWEKNDLAKAIECFNKGVSLKPNARNHSLGLFHTLRLNNQLEEAKQELERFLTIMASDEHKMLLGELKVRKGSATDLGSKGNMNSRANQ